MDLSKYRNKLIGSDDERAVSPVIGVILMVAITVILAAVIAAFVLDLGDDMGSGSVNAAVESDVSNSDGEIDLDVTEMGDAEEIIIRGDVREEISDIDNDENREIVGDGEGVRLTDLSNTGDSTTLISEDSDGTGALNTDSGSANIVAVSGDSESQIGSIEWDFE